MKVAKISLKSIKLQYDTDNQHLTIVFTFKISITDANNNNRQRQRRCLQAHSLYTHITSVMIIRFAVINQKFFVVNFSIRCR